MNDQTAMLTTGVCAAAGLRAGPPDDVPASLDEVLARLTACVAAIEADSTVSSVAARLTRNRHALYAAMDVLGGWLNGFLAAAPSTPQLEAVRARITGMIRPWSRTGPFFDRCYAQARGQPGAFEITELIYNCRPGGADLRARLFDDYYLHTVTARAIRARLTHLTNRLSEVTAACVQRGVAPVRVLCLGAGPARELRTLAESPAFGETAVITCLDPDAEALRFVRNRLAAYFNGCITYLRADPLRFARGPSRPGRPYHIIYAAGLFDHLPADQAAQLIQDCHGLLAPGGRLFVSNLSARVPANERTLLAWLLEWRPHYRTEEAYQGLFAQTSFGAAGLHFTHAPLATYLFVESVSAG